MVDKYTGVQIRAKRKSKGMSLKQLAAEIGVTFQQLWKYEHGSNITVKRLNQIAVALAARPASFFPDGPSDRWRQASGRCARLSG